MSVIIRYKDGKIKLYCKGADSLIMNRLREDTSNLLREATMQHLDKFASDGLRTLCCGFKEIDPDYIAEWSVSRKYALKIERAYLGTSTRSCIRYEK
jgi:phospholipid-transporting ATPase